MYSKIQKYWNRSSKRAAAEKSRKFNQPWLLCTFLPGVHLQCSYISFSVLFQTKSSLVWKRYTKKMRRIFQTNSSLIWKEKLVFCKTQIPNQIQIGLENFEDQCQRHENSKPNSVWFGKIIDSY